VHFRLDAEDLLDVMSELVGDDIGLREISGCGETLPQLIEEGQVEIDPLVVRTIERS